MAPACPIVVGAGAEGREPAPQHDTITGLDHAQCCDLAAGGASQQRSVGTVTHVDPDQHAWLVGGTTRVLGRRHRRPSLVVAPFDRGGQRRVRLTVDRAAHHGTTERRGRERREGAAAPRSL